MRGETGILGLFFSESDSEWTMLAPPGYSGTRTGADVSRWPPKFLNMKIVETKFHNQFLCLPPFLFSPLHVKNGYTASKTKHDLIQPPSVSGFAGKGTGLGRQAMASSVRAHWLSGRIVGFENGNGRYRTVPDGRITTIARNRAGKQNRNVGDAR